MQNGLSQKIIYSAYQTKGVVWREMHSCMRLHKNFNNILIEKHATHYIKTIYYILVQDAIIAEILYGARKT